MKVTNIGTGQYHRKATVCVCANGYAGFGRRSGENTKVPVAAALRNARLTMFKLPIQNQTMSHVLSFEYRGVEVVLLPGDEDLVASLMTLFLLNFVGIFEGRVVSNSSKDNLLLLGL